MTIPCNQVRYSAATPCSVTFCPKKKMEVGWWAALAPAKPQLFLFCRFGLTRHLPGKQGIFPQRNITLLVSSSRGCIKWHCWSLLTDMRWRLILLFGNWFSFFPFLHASPLQTFPGNDLLRSQVTALFFWNPPLPIGVAFHFLVSIYFLNSAFDRHADMRQPSMLLWEALTTHGNSSACKQSFGSRFYLRILLIVGFSFKNGYL